MTHEGWRTPLWARIAAAELPLVLLVAPALLFPTPHRLWVVLAVPITWIACRRCGGSWVPSTPLNASVLALLTMTAVSLWATFDVAFSLGKVSGVILGALLFWAATRWTTTARRLRAATAAFLLAGGGLAILGLLGTNWIGKFPLMGSLVARMPRVIRGVPGAEAGFQPNAVAGCLVLFIPLQVALLAEGGRWWRVPGSPRSARWLLIQGALLVMTTGTLALTQSRGAGVGLLVAFVAVLTWIGPRTRVLAAVAIVAVGFLAITLGPSRLLKVAISRSGTGIASDVSSRTELWSRALYGIQDFPLTGMGMNTFRTVMPAIYPTFLTAADAPVPHAHNHLLQAALDLGLPGLIAYLAMWLGTAGLLVRVYRRSRVPSYRAMAGGLGAGLIAHFMFGTTDAIPLGAKVGILFWMTLALCVSLHQVALPEKPVQPE